VLPGLGHHRGRLQEHPEHPQVLVDPDRVVGFDAPALGHEPIDLLDAPLGVTAVGAHVPLADGAVRAGRRVGSADDPHHVFTDAKAAGTGVKHPTE
jgi:hypothetical protein